MKRIDAAIAIVTKGQYILVCQRKDADTLGGLWEFPGGKCEEGETMEQCLARELHEEVNLVATPLVRLTPIEHDYPYAQIRLHPFICRHESGDPELLECQAARWIEPVQLREYQFPPANETLIEEVIDHLCASSDAMSVT
jgi:mutator protein MutT